MAQAYDLTQQRAHSLQYPAAGSQRCAALRLTAVPLLQELHKMLQQHMGAQTSPALRYCLCEINPCIYTGIQNGLTEVLGIGFRV